MSGIDLSTLWRENVLDLLTDGTRYVALLATAATVTDTGSTLVEVSYSGYARVAIPSWGATVDSRRLNDTAITFTPVDVVLSVVGFAVVSASTAGQLVAFCEFLPAEVLAVGETPVFEVGTLAIATAGAELVS